jgi:exportin-2 (importin alpha re-exporter)
VTQIDFEEQSTGYQAAYSKLSASEGVTVDPVAYVNDPRGYLVEGLNGLNLEHQGFQRQVLARCDMSVCGPFLEEAGLGF